MKIDVDLLSHPRDIATFALDRLAFGIRVALVFVTATEGGSVRMPGLRMAITEDGTMIGYVSNGCIEADVVASARAAIAKGCTVMAAYGRGSGKIDFSLPCGGRVELAIVPLASENSQALQQMVGSGRQFGKITVRADGKIAWKPEGSIALELDWAFPVVPKIRLWVIGSGNEAIYLSRLAIVADIDVQLLTPDHATLKRGNHLKLNVHALNGLASQPALDIDEVTAVALMFHDHEWETRFLTELTASSAFYIGALGSRRAHLHRIESLTTAGCSPNQIARIRAPIGIVQRLRDPNLLASSVIAEIASEFQKRYGSF